MKAYKLSDALRNYSINMKMTLGNREKLKQMKTHYDIMLIIQFYLLAIKEQ